MLNQYMDFERNCGKNNEEENIIFDLKAYDLAPEDVKKAEDLIEDIMQKLQFNELTKLNENEIEDAMEALFFKSLQDIK